MTLGRVGECAEPGTRMGPRQPSPALHHHLAIAEALAFKMYITIQKRK